MFTGIIERTAAIAGISIHPGFKRIQLAVPWADIRDGESIAVNGVCLTIAKIDGQIIDFDVIPETLSKTNLDRLRIGDRVNLERSLRVGDRIDGHFVQGHVDGTAPILEQRSPTGSDGGEWRIVAEAPADLARYLIPKGSICLDGVSLTIAAINGRRLEVALIPTTLKITNLGDRPIGWPLNLEADIFSKTIVSYLERRRDWVEDQAM
jgi:riboflavin synthase